MTWIDRGAGSRGRPPCRSVSISDLVVMVLEDEGYAVIVCLTPRDAMALLNRLSFDLVITDGFSREPGTVFVNTADLVRSAGLTPVALF